LEKWQTFRANIRNIQFSLYYKSRIESRLFASERYISQQFFESGTFDRAMLLFQILFSAIFFYLPCTNPAQRGENRGEKTKLQKYQIQKTMILCGVSKPKRV